MSPRALSHDAYRVGWICPLAVEQIAAMEMLDEEHQLLPQPSGDTNIYHLGSINSHHVVIAGLPKTGNCSAAAVVTQMRLTFPNLKYGLLVGIGGGVPIETEDGSIRLGHVVVSTPTGTHSGVVQYDHGKAKAGQIERTGALAPPPATLLNAVQALAVQRARMDYDPVWEDVQRIQTCRRGLRRFKSPGAANDHLYQRDYIHQQAGQSCEASGCDPNRRVKRPTDDDDETFVVVHRGTIASGELVIKDAELRDRLAPQDGLLCFEMEAAGALTDFPCMVIRGISDYCDSHKNDQWHGYAAAVAAAYARRLFFHMPIEAVQRNERNPEGINPATVRSSGLTILHDPPEPIADIVLIPGLAGDPWDTWSPSSRHESRLDTSGQFWPVSFLPKDCPAARIVVWGFRPSSEFQMGRFLDQASELLRALTHCRPPGRSMVFVAHSIGGLLLKETLWLADKGQSMATKDILNYTSAVTFLDTPHQGDGGDLCFSDVVQRALAGYAMGGIEEQLLSGGIDARLEECRVSFLGQRRTHKFRVKCFAEDPREQQAQYILPPSAATLEEHQVETLAASPTGFCRFQDKSDPSYRKILGDLQVTLDQIEWDQLRLRQDCLKSLHFNELQTRESDITPALESTAVWLFETEIYKDWTRWNAGESKKRGLFWIRGKPGSGKSTLMKNALRRAKSTGLNSSFSVTGFFFTVRSNIRLQKSALGLFRTLLYDLIQQDKALLSAFIIEYKKKCAMNPGLWEWHQNELQDFFKSTYTGENSPVRNAMVFIDALDESDQEGDNAAYQVARDLVYFFRDVTAGQKLKVCLSSRHYPNIRVPDCPQIATEEFNGDDIVHFVTTKLSGAHHNARARGLAGQIAAKANGVFLWVILVVGILNMNLDNSMTDKDLQETLNSVPVPLDDLFRSLFAKSSTKSEMHMAATIFQWILLAERPLEKDELRHALTIDREKIDVPGATGVWNESGSCLPADPESFLTSVRFYTRGLAEVTQIQKKRKGRYQGGRRHRASFTSACDSCRVRKVRCDKDTPCSHCRENNFICTYTSAETEYTGGPSLVQFIHESVREFFSKHGGFLVLESDHTERSIAERHEVLAEHCMACICQNGHVYGSCSRRSLMRQYPFLRYAVKSLFYHAYEAERGGRVSGRLIQSLTASDQSLWKSWVALARVFHAFPIGLNVLMEDASGIAPFHILCRTRMFLSASALLRSGVDVNLQDARGYSALHHAVSDLAVEVVQFLVKSNANLRVKSCDGETPLHLAGHYLAPAYVLEDLLQPFVIQRSCLEDTDLGGHTPLHAAVLRGNATAVQILLFHGAETNCKTAGGDTPLHQAVIRHDRKIITTLLDFGANPNSVNASGVAPIHLAAEQSTDEFIDLLSRRSADLSLRNKEGRTPLQILLEACPKTSPWNANIMAGMPNNLNTNIDGSPGMHPMSNCFAPSTVNNLRALAKASENGMATDVSGKSPLHYLADSADPSLLHAFLQVHRKAALSSISQRDNSGRTPLHYAAQQQTLHGFKLLVYAGADLGIIDSNGATPVDIAGKKVASDPYVLKFLEWKGLRYKG